MTINSTPTVPLTDTTRIGMSLPGFFLSVHFGTVETPLRAHTCARSLSIRRRLGSLLDLPIRFSIIPGTTGLARGGGAS